MYQCVLEVFVRICVRIFAHAFVRINVRTSIRIFDIIICPYQDIMAYPVRICTHPGSYFDDLHLSQSVSARIPVRTCMYRSPYLNVYPYGSTRIPCLSRFVSARALFVSEFAINYTFGQTCGASQISHKLIHNHPRTVTHPRSLCRLFLTPARKRRCLASAASATASAGETAKIVRAASQIP